MYGTIFTVQYFTQKKRSRKTDLADLRSACGKFGNIDTEFEYDTRIRRFTPTGGGGRGNGGY